MTIPPWITAPRRIPPVKYLRTIAHHQVPLWTVIEKYFELSRFESEFCLSEANIATEDSSRGGIINLLSELWPFCTFFRWCCVTESRN